MLGMTATLINDSAVVTMIVWQTYEYDDETLDLHTSSAQSSVYACRFSSAWSQCCCRLAISVSNIAIEIECRRGEKEEASRADVFSLLVVKCAPRASHIFTWPHSQLCRRAFECARACFILILSTRTGYRRTVLVVSDCEIKKERICLAATLAWRHARSVLEKHPCAPHDLNILFYFSLLCFALQPILFIKPTLLESLVLVAPSIGFRCGNWNWSSNAFIPRIAFARFRFPSLFTISQINTKYKVQCNINWPSHCCLPACPSPSPSLSHAYQSAGQIPLFRIRYPATINGFTTSHRIREENQALLCKGFECSRTFATQTHSKEDPKVKARIAGHCEKRAMHLCSYVLWLRWREMAGSLKLERDEEKTSFRGGFFVFFGFCLLVRTVRWRWKGIGNGMSRLLHFEL